MRFGLPTFILAVMVSAALSPVWAQVSPANQTGQAGQISTHAECTIAGAQFGSTSCAQRIVRDSVWVPGVSAAKTANNTVYLQWGSGPSGATLRARGVINQGFNGVLAGGGIVNADSVWITQRGVGDFLVHNDNTYSAMGIADQGDQGHNHIYHQGGEEMGYPRGKVISGGQGSTSPALNTLGGCNSPGADACITSLRSTLLDTETPYAEGYLTSRSDTVTPGGANWLRQMSVTNTLPRTSAWGYTTGVKFDIVTNPNLPVAKSATVHGGSGSLTTGLACFVGEQYEEQALITDVRGTAPNQTWTAGLVYPNDNIAVFQGGPCGTYMSMNADHTLFGVRTTYAVVGSLTGHEAIVATQSVATTNNFSIPIGGSEPETVAGASDPNSGYQLFCGSQVVNNGSATASVPTLMPNNCAWAPGDAVENPHFQQQNVIGLWEILNMNMPTGVGTISGAQFIIGGMGAASRSYGVDVENRNTLYTNMTQPLCSYCSGLMFPTYFRYGNFSRYAPLLAVNFVENHQPRQTSYEVFADGSWGSISIDNTSTFRTKNAGFATQIDMSVGRNLNVAGASAVAGASTVAGSRVCTVATGCALLGATDAIGGSPLAAGSCVSGTTSVGGARTGSPVSVAAADGSLPSGLTVLSAAVTAPGKVTVQLCAVAATTPALRSYKVAVLQ